MGNINHPIYIWSAPWRDNSAGIKVLHFLCHILNSMGYKAWLIIPSVKNVKTHTNHKLNTPILTKKLLRKHFSDSLTPITIYSETILNNPLKSDYSVCYILNYDNFFGTEIKLQNFQKILLYSKDLDVENESLDVCWIPTIIDNELPELKHNHKKLLYAGKYRMLIGPPPILQKDHEIIEIFRDGKHRQSRQEVLELLSEGKCLYLYENTMLSLEARLIGVPVVMLSSPLSQKPIGNSELGSLGITHSDSNQALLLAQEELNTFKKIYRENLDRIRPNLLEIVENWQKEVRNVKYERILRYPIPIISHSKVSYNLSVGLFKKIGMRKLIMRVFYKIYEIGKK